jgi:hypothetical protein
MVRKFPDNQYNLQNSIAFHETITLIRESFLHVQYCIILRVFYLTDINGR